MCHYIAATLSPGANVAPIRAIADQFKLDLAPLQNRYVQRQLVAGESLFLTTRGECDCGTVLGSLKAPDTSPGDYTQQVRRLREKGWGQAKINRWVEQKEENRANRARIAEEKLAVESRAAEDWLSFSAGRSRIRACGVCRPALAFLFWLDYG